MSDRQRVKKVWRAFAVEPQKEGVAKIILERNGYDAEVPIEIVMRRASRYDKRKVPWPSVMMVGYVFVRLPIDYPWGELMDFRIVRAPVTFNGRIAALSDKVMDRLLSHPQDAAPHRRSVNTRASFAVGDVVEVAEGAFQGWTGKVEELRGKKARMIFKMFASHRELDIPLELLHAA